MRTPSPPVCPLRRHAKMRPPLSLLYRLFLTPSLFRHLHSPFNYHSIVCPESPLAGCVSSQDDRPASFLAPWEYDGQHTQ